MKRFYEQNEWVDLSRLETIKKAFSAYNLLQTETMVQNTQSIEHSLNSIQQFVTSEQISEFCSVYRDLNLSSSSLSTSNKLAGKIDTGFGSWILRPRKNSVFNASQVSVASEISTREPRTGSMISFGSFDNPPQPLPVAVDDDGFSVPPPENMHSEGDRDSDEFSDSSSFAPQQKVKFDIKEEAIKDKPEDIALAFSNVTSSLRTLPKQKVPRGRRGDRSMTDLERTLSTVPEKVYVESPSESISGFKPLGLRAWSVERVDAVVMPDGSCRAQVTGELRVVYSNHDSCIDYLNSTLASLQDGEIQIVPNPQFVTEANPGFTLHLDNLEAVKDHEVVLLMYRIQMVAPSAHHPLLPLSINAAFDADPNALRVGLSFGVKDSIKPKRVNSMKIGANVKQSGSLRSQPAPNWNQASNELIWDLDFDQLVPIVCQFDGVADLLLSFSFDLLLESSLANINWSSMSMDHTVQSGAFLLTSSPLANSVDGL
ncbi:hypothetical protein DSO57_1021801 [Entomophthora muscae]|uniref:Uncharacterized protein n=1 Tax=Entomophthora muscae TaxID=34485 RepID=A0ACC2U1M3_9FUNG|nr:hypothetical protein DSO57_1021801 [Entomophthora muscae]